jgi:hypothetical protein
MEESLGLVRVALSSGEGSFDQIRCSSNTHFLCLVSGYPKGCASILIASFGTSGGGVKKGSEKLIGWHGTI